MNTAHRRLAVGAAILAIVGFVASYGAIATAGNSSRTFKVELTGFQEDPLTVSTTGSGMLRLKVDGQGKKLTYQLRYANLSGSVTQAHIHFGGVAQSGGISAWLCQTATNPGPVGTPDCPASSGTVTGTIEAANVVGPTGQGIEAGALDELLDAIRAETTYVNVHSTRFPGGEIRSQIADHHH
jgi:hypothetical protein